MNGRKRPLISCIAACARGGVIGRDGDLPWPPHRRDMQRFRRLTMGKPVIMGRRTHRSLPRPLDGRDMIVVSTTMPPSPLSPPPSPSPAVVADPEEALRVAVEAARRRGAGAAAEIMVIGGARIFDFFLPRADRLYMSWIDADCPGDVFFPPFDENEWDVVASQSADDRMNADDRTPAADRTPPTLFVAMHRRPRRRAARAGERPSEEKNEAPPESVPWRR